MDQSTLTINTKAGIIGGCMLTIFSNITFTDVEKTIVLGAIGTVVSFIVSLLTKSIYELTKTILKLKLTMTTQVNQMNLVQRIAAPTPKFFKTLRTIGLILAATGGTLLASPIALPVAVTAVAGYLTVAAGVLTAVSSVTVDEEAVKAKEGLKATEWL